MDNKDREKDSSLTIRLPKELKDAANKKAEANSQILSELIRKFLQGYIDGK